MSHVSQHVSEGINVESASGTATRAVRIAVVMGFALLTWAGARISVPLPLTPVPGTLQTLAVLLAGGLLGARAGAASQVIYIMIGLAGLPVFALPGSGPAYLLGPTAGYLIGFVIAPYLVGRLIAGRLGANPVGVFVSFLLGALSIHACGFAWLSVLLGSPLSALRAGFLPFVLFDFAKVVVATGIHTGYVRWKPLKRS